MLLACFISIFLLLAFLLIEVKNLKIMVGLSLKRQSILLSRLLVFEDTYGNEFVIRVKTDLIDSGDE